MAIIAAISQTNTGNTHYDLYSFVANKPGIHRLPLRIFTMQVYDKLIIYNITQQSDMLTVD